MSSSNWEREVRKHLWLNIIPRDKLEEHGIVNDQEGWEDAPCTKYCRECQKTKPITEFRWSPPVYREGGLAVANPDHELSKRARELQLVEPEEFVYCLYYLSNDHGTSIHHRLGGTQRQAAYALTVLAKEEADD